MKRTQLIAWTAMLLLPASHLIAAQPNFVLVMSDDQGWGDAGYQGHPTLKTPHLDAMAADGMRFNRFYAGAPVCSPTRGSVLTGRHPYRYGIFFANTGHLLARELTIAEILKERGYATGHFGKWHLGTLTKTGLDSNRGGARNQKHFSPPWTNGFESNFSTEAKTPTFDPYLRPKNENGKTWWDPVKDASAAIPYGTRYWKKGQAVSGPLRGDDSRIIMDAALEFLRHSTDAERPFFAVIWFHAPHLPVVASSADRKQYQMHDKYTQHYLGSITALDRQVGRLRSELTRLGAADNTLLMFCSDNGPEGKDNAPGIAKPLRGRKRSLYEGGIRVPGLAVWPGRIKPGSETSTPACTQDYLPTILAAADADYPDARPLDGIDLSPVFANPSVKRKRGIGFQSGNQVAWIEDRYKLYGSSPGSKKELKNQNLRYELYDLTVDPRESTDLAIREPTLLQDKISRFQAWQESCRRSLEKGP